MSLGLVTMVATTSAQSDHIQGSRAADQEHREAGLIPASQVFAGMSDALRLSQPGRARELCESLMIDCLICVNDRILLSYSLSYRVRTISDVGARNQREYVLLWKATL